jgi:tetrapyrrole methylase family protein/MazG family protein
MTREAWDWLSAQTQVVVRTKKHPCVAELPKSLEVLSFDDYYQNGETFEAVYEKIILKVLELGQRPGGVTYAVPGHPYIAETTGPEIARRAKQMGLPIRIIDGLSFIEPVFSTLGIDPFPHTALVDALELSLLHTPPFPPDQPALVAQVYSRQVAAQVKLALEQIYPDEHPVKLVHAAGTSKQVVEELMLYEIDRSRKIDLLTVLYLPPLEKDTSFEQFQEIIARLRAPDGCPWDRQQTAVTLRRYLVEEAYEVIEAIDNQSPEGMTEEFGDLLLQIVLQVQIATEEGEFTMPDVIQGITRKLVRRHPHVFGEVQVDGVKDVLQNWEQIKGEERKEKGVTEEKGLLDGVPKVLPGLAQSQELQDRAARVGFDWDHIQSVWEKVDEEMREIRAAEGNEEKLAEEVGDLLFAAVNLARWLKVDAESALRGTNQKFRRRFAYIERKARQQGRALAGMSLAEMDALWNEAKLLEHGAD